MEGGERERGEVGLEEGDGVGEGECGDERVEDVDVCWPFGGGFVVDEADGGDVAAEVGGEEDGERGFG